MAYRLFETTSSVFLSPLHDEGAYKGTTCDYGAEDSRMAFSCCCASSKYSETLLCNIVTRETSVLPFFFAFWMYTQKYHAAMAGGACEIGLSHHAEHLLSVQFDGLVRQTSSRLCGMCVAWQQPVGDAEDRI